MVEEFKEFRALMKRLEKAIAEDDIPAALAVHDEMRDWASNVEPWVSDMVDWCNQYRFYR